MINIVVHFSRCSNVSTLASAGIAKYIAGRIGGKIIDSPGVMLKPDNLIIVNSLYIFCNFRKEVEYLVENAKNVIWVQNDYDLPIPKFIRDKITCIMSTIKQPNDPLFRYINWNLLTYKPCVRPGKHDIDGLFYYGACRDDRIQYFKKYLNSELYKIYISSTSKGGRKFRDICKNASIIKAWNTYTQLQRFQTTLYIEDKYSHKNYCSPANRFYEYLSAGLAILFDKSCLNTFDTAGYDITPYIVDNANDVYEKLKEYDKIVKKQKEWHRDYISELNDTFDEVWEGYK